MSKSLDNGIYLGDDEDTVYQKIMRMYTDPNHLKISDPGQLDGNIVFTYLDIFGEDKKTISEMKENYKNGGLGDVAVKKYLNEVLQAKLTPIRQRRLEYVQNLDYVRQVLQDGSKKARAKAAETLSEVRAAIGVNYFD
jgi:tryptophanyl-tRNA synthetase